MHTFSAKSLQHRWLFSKYSEADPSAVGLAVLTPPETLQEEERDRERREREEAASREVDAGKRKVSPVNCKRVGRDRVETYCGGSLSFHLD